MATTDKLPERVQALPQELYDEIYNLTFTALDKAMVTVQIDKEYCSPALLQVNRASRGLFAEAYYARSNFRFKGDRYFVEWHRSLPHEHVSMLGDVVKDMVLPSRMMDWVKSNTEEEMTELLEEGISGQFFQWSMHGVDGYILDEKSIFYLRIQIWYNGSRIMLSNTLEEHSADKRPIYSEYSQTIREAYALQ